MHMFYADVSMTVGAKLPISTEYEERAVFIAEGGVEFLPNAGTFKAGQLLILKPKQEITLSCISTSTRLLLLGGELLPEKRHIWWNFVSSSKERIEQAKEDWKQKRFGQVPEETDYIPLPADSRPVVVRYP